MKRTLFSLALVFASALLAHHGSARASDLERQTAAQVLLHASGNGISNTSSFKAPGDWRIVYSFNHCQIPGFDIYVMGGATDTFSTYGNSGRGTEYVHAGGRVYLSMNTACSWSVIVYSGAPILNGPGFSVSGDGIANTVRLRVPSDWRITYRYSRCQIPGFDIYVMGDVTDIMSKAGSSGHGVQYEHSGGTIYLSMNTACSWKVGISR